AADFPILDAEVEVRPQELTMASSLVESLAGDFAPEQFEDAYQAALEQLIEQKVSAGRTVATPAASETTGGDEEGGEVIDLLSALQRSVEKARSARGDAPEQDAPKAPARKKPAKKAASARKPSGS